MSSKLFSCLLQRNAKSYVSFKSADSLITSRQLSSNVYNAISYEKFGDPNEVLKLNEVNYVSPGPTEVVIKMLMSPINPADINMIQGNYGIKPTLPAIGGNEGIGEVIQVGSDVKELKIGSWVIPRVPALPGQGMWAQFSKWQAPSLLEIPKDISPVSAATLAVNPCTAYRMLMDFVDLKPGDTVIQNAANSAVGLAVIQIARSLLKVNTVNIIRNRQDVDELKDEMTKLGATHVLTDEETKTDKMKQLFQNIPRAKLALNAVGGKATIPLIKAMQERSTMIVYGGMSGQPLMLPVGPLIFKHINITGFWITKWIHENPDNPERTRMIDKLCDMIRNKTLQPPPVSLHSFIDYREAISLSMKPYKGRKPILVMDDNYL